MEKGDKIKFIHQKLEGTVVQIQSNGTIEIELLDGFIITAQPHELVAIDRNNDFMSTNISTQKIKQSIAIKEKKVKKHQQSISTIIDLHIEKLAKDYKKLNSSQIISIQLAHFDSKLKSAIRLKQKEVVCVHGIGKGVLRKQIHELLKGNLSVKEYYNLNDRGATKIIFK